MELTGAVDEESEELLRFLSNKQLQRAILRPKKMKMQTLAGAGGRATPAIQHQHH